MSDQCESDEARRQAIIDLADQYLASGRYPSAKIGSHHKGVGPTVDQFARATGGLFGPIVGGLAAIGLISAWIVKEK
ncbi:MAG: hypothetical protein L0387_39295 [Acidobacteria bacterium]|nr:hypothetical protein [Acidobacteriota bacterium]